MRFDESERATFKVTKVIEGSLDTLRAPIAVFGNVATAIQGESVFEEVLGSGEPREPNQTFKLGQKPLTYIDGTANNGMGRSTLSVSVNGVRWEEVGSFYGAGPEDQVYVVRHDDDLNSFVTFGDGKRGARLPSGVDNVVADYRYGANSKALPAGVMNQLARPSEGLVGVRGPVPGMGGRDPDDPAQLRTLAPRSMQLLGSAVGLRDFECVAGLCEGVVVAKAEYDWLKLEGQAGVRLSYIGQAVPSVVLSKLRDYAEPNLALRVEQATAITCRLELTLGVQTKYDKAAVCKQVRDQLTEIEQGLLSLKQSQIGGTLWMSKVYELALSVPGVVSVESGTLYRNYYSAQSIAQTDNFCANVGSYFHFPGEYGLSVTSVEA